MRLALLLLTLATALLNAPAQAQTNVERRATELIDAGRPAEAYALLRNDRAGASSAQRWFLTGVAAYRARNLDGAESAFRRSLALDPNAPRVKLELARVLQEKGAAAEAQRLFLEVRALNPPARVAANIDRFLAMMNDRNKTGTAWRARATIGIGGDSNVNEGTSARTVNLFGLPFALAPNARKRGDLFGFLRGEVDVVTRFSPEWAWTTNLAFAARRYIRENDYNSYALEASTGPVWQPNASTTILLPVFATVRRYENTGPIPDRASYSLDYGFAPQVRYALNKMVTLNFTGTIAGRRNFDDSARDALVLRAIPAVDVQISPVSVVSAGLIFGRENASADVYSRTSQGALLGLRYAFAKNLVASLYGTHEYIDYDAREAMNDRIRKDHRTLLGLDAIWTPDWAGGDIVFTYAHTWNKSNLPLYAYNRDLVTLGYRRGF